MKFSIFSKNKGFTLVEMMVVTSIAVTIMTALIFQQNQWNDQLSLNSEAYSLVLAIRQAQFYSLSVRENTVGSGDFDAGYGVYLNQNTLGQYIYFADRNKNQLFDTGETLETKDIGRGIRIKDVCGPNQCFFTGSLRRVHISFYRPETNASIKLLNNGGSSVDQPPVTITLESPGGREISIKVEANGQVSIIQ